VIVRATTADVHNYIANHPEVKPTFGYQEGLTDLSPLFEHPEQYILLHDNEGAASIFDWSAPGVWQGHSMFLPRRRGKEGIQSAKDMLGWMFDYGAKMIWGMTPTSDDFRRAHIFNRLLGFRACGFRTDGAGREVCLFEMER
jgi:hypothetical protein